MEVRQDLPYVDGVEAGHGKQNLDLFLPKGRTSFPILIFVHGGSWAIGDRSWFGNLGRYFASQGIGVAIPSYRLMPLHPHPAQIEDVASAFAWTYQNIERYGGDPRRIYVAGHSSGGHLASLLALDEKYLEKYQLSSRLIRGVVSISGVYDVGPMLLFLAKGNKEDASPLAHVRPGAPPFLLAFCQWDYAGLPGQAQEFAKALRQASVPADVIYIPGDGHLTELRHVARGEGPLTHAILNFVH